MSDSSTSTPQVLVIVTYQVAEEDRAKFERIAGAHAAAGDTYPGCRRFSLSRDVVHRGLYQVIELWRSQADLDGHNRSEAFHTTMTALKECRTLTMQPDRYEVA